MNLGSWRQLLFLFLINLVGLTIAQSDLPEFLSYFFCNDGGSSLVYQANRANLIRMMRMRRRMAQFFFPSMTQELNSGFQDSMETSFVESLQYDFNSISIATEDFSYANKLGEGGFGAVYWGRIPKGQEIAVKRFAKDSRQGDLEFKNEVMLVAKLQHRNLVRLLGFCLEGTERLLIYEFMTNSSLDRLLFGLEKLEERNNFKSHRSHIEGGFWFCA